MDAKHYTQVLIDGKIYTLGGNEEESYLQKAAGYVNDKNKELRRIPGFSKQSADYQAVMIQLNMADDYFKALERADELEKSRDGMEKETYSLKHELVGTKMKLEAVLKDLEERQRELEELKRRSEHLEGELAALRGAAKEAAAGKEEIEVSDRLDVKAEVSETVSASAQQRTSAGGSVREQLRQSEDELARRALAAAQRAVGQTRDGRQ